MIENTRIEKVQSVKYLGITITDKLKWSEHINNRIKSAKRLLFKLKGFIGKTWGPCPEMVRYAYLSTVRAQLAYASFAFADKLTKKNILCWYPFLDNFCRQPSRMNSRSFWSSWDSKLPPRSRWSSASLMKFS